MATQDPIAVVGMACRFPGASSISSYWRLLESCNEVNLSESTDRPIPGSSKERARFLPEIGYFDAAFFNISEQEARTMDPQQRMLLELAWESLLDAGVMHEHARRLRTGVYIGAMWRDYETLAGGALSRQTLPGNDSSFLSGGIAHHLHLRGPALTLQTSTSSSLVAIHLACQALRTGDAEVALAGGVNLILSSRGGELLRKLGVLAPDGRSKPFSRYANGYGRGEGAGVVVLKTLQRALDDGDRIYSIVRGSAVDHNGGGSSIAAPNSEGQEALINRAYMSAGISASGVNYLEAHGTGTSAGDAAELRALEAVFGSGRGVRIGSVKSQIGHLEAASGVAGFIKTALVLYRRTIPAFRPFAPLHENGGVRLSYDSEVWSDESQLLLAGVSSFGLSGTNCHVVLEQWPTHDVSDQAGIDLLRHSWRREEYWPEQETEGTPTFDEELASLLQVPAAGLQDRDKLIDLGIDSLIAVELSERLERNFGIQSGPIHRLYSMTVGELRSMTDQTAEVQS